MDKHNLARATLKDTIAEFVNDYSMSEVFDVAAEVASNLSEHAMPCSRKGWKEVKEISKEVSEDIAETCRQIRLRIENASKRVKSI